MTLDEYVAWAAGVGSRHGGRPEDLTLLEAGLGFASEIGEVAGVLAKWLRDDEPRRDRLVDELGDVWRYWTRLCVAGGTTPAEVLGRSRAKIERRLAAAGRMTSAGPTDRG